METSLNGLIEIAGHEGIVLSPYLDSVGVWTIFIGHTKAAGDPDPLSFPKGVEQEASKAIRVFKQDIKSVEARVNNALKVPVSQHEFDALVSFDFNTGGIFKAQITKLLNSGEKEKATLAFNNWHKPIEIIPRRNKERDLFKTGIYQNHGIVTIYPADTSGHVSYGNGRHANLRELLQQPQSPPSLPEKPTSVEETNSSLPNKEKLTCFSILKKLLNIK